MFEAKFQCVHVGGLNGPVQSMVKGCQQQRFEQKKRPPCKRRRLR